MPKHEKFLIGFAFLSFGMVLGFILAPIKKGVTVSCGNNNTMLPHGGHGCRGRRQAEARPGPVPVSDEVSEENL